MHLKQWPAAKYLSYAFWRSWILSVYTAPIWSLLAVDGVAEQAWLTMYLASTVAYIAMCSLCAVFFRRAAGALNAPVFLLVLGACSSAGVIVEFFDIWSSTSGPGLLFVIGAIITGICTAPISIRAGQIYAQTRPAVAVSNTALSEVAAGLIYFLVIGTPPAIALFVVIALPFLATAVACLDPLRIEPVERTDDETARAIGRTHAGAFVRFLVVIFVATFVAYFLRGVFSVEAGAVVAVGSAGVALLVFASFGIALLGSMRGSFSFTSMYYPLILLLCAACLLLLVLEVANGALQAVVICLYSLTSLFSWCMLCYASKSDYWDPIQVFGWGRAAFALGSLVGIVAAGGAQTLAADAVADYLRVCGVVLALALIACAMVVFRERDIMAITKAAWLIEDARIRERTAAPVDDAPAAAQTFRAGASVGGDADDGSGTHGPTPDRAASFDQAASAVAAAPQRAEQAGDPTTVTVDDFADEHNLTRREREVLPLMLEGRGSKSIGETLVISENTAKSHIRSIYAKCGVHTRTEFIDATAAVHR